MNLAPVYHALLMQARTVILPVPLSSAQAATWPSGASVVSVVDPITIALTTIVFVLLLILKGSTVMVPPLVLLLRAFYY